MSALCRRSGQAPGCFAFGTAIRRGAYHEGRIMPLREGFKLALQSLWGNKLRTILTLIGVVMGVASVIMVITLVDDDNRYVGTKLSGYGADVFTVTRMTAVSFGAEDYFRYHRRKIIRYEDYE